MAPRFIRFVNHLANHGHDLYPRARDLRFPRALDHVRPGVGHGPLYSYIRDVPARPDHAVRTPRTPRTARAHLQPGLDDAAQEELRRGEKPRRARLAHVRHRPSLDAPLPRLHRGGEDPEAPPPERTRELRRAVFVDLPRGSHQIRLHRLRVPRQLHRRAHAHASRARRARRTHAYADRRFVRHPQPYVERRRGHHSH